MYCKDFNVAIARYWLQLARNRVKFMGLVKDIMKNNIHPLCDICGCGKFKGHRSVNVYLATAGQIDWNAIDR